ncbi:hypothetical protein NQ318_020675 [Aromia moschata]|uniref:EF-hand domain-containing protein n=1 Tax=Aromia moschata TaxID=1265417 RepID=A0AAV8XXL3_9CUCU|nr:hypothetical protein NQ318_020675 [Aromia moschata]
MATASKLFRRYLNKTNTNTLRQLSKISANSINKNRPLTVICVLGGAVALYTTYRVRSIQKVHAAQSKNDDDTKVVKLTSREKRFIRFMSVEYDGQLYMTPQDFLESVVEAEPRRSPRIISYTEYLFLLSILTITLINHSLGFGLHLTCSIPTVTKELTKNEFLVMEKIFSHAWKGKRGLSHEDIEKVMPIQEQYVDDEQGLQRKHVVDTTLIVHFFGPKGNNDLNFESFKKFMLHLQTEVLELEFSEFSRGLPTISEVDFAKILLRYTYLDTDEYDMYLDRLLDRIKRWERGITFEEFHVFCQFLNNLEDFSIAMRMYTLADHPISKDEFHRAVKICTGTDLSPHIVHTVFAIFDNDGDGLLSYREFIAIMKDRLHRGFKSYAKNEGWEAFKTCIKQEMKAPT